MENLNKGIAIGMVNDLAMRRPIMTTHQERSIKKIKAYVEENDTYNSNEKYEIKEWQVEEIKHGVVSVYVVSGLKNDEGTLAATLARTTRQIFIGPQGGVRAYVWDEKKKKTVHKTGWSKVMSLGGRQL